MSTGTGKTTTARKMGQIFFDMGFLSTTDLVESSATDLIGSYVGHTGPKVIKVLEKALGKVLFIDEAYRLKHGNFATEAINELVDSLTKPRFFRRIIVILAGYEENMNELLGVNQGLSSRFSEEVIFKNMKPEDCWNLMTQLLAKKGIKVDRTDPDSNPSEIVFPLFEELSCLDGWGNGRDVDTISQSIVRSTIRDASDSDTQLSISYAQIRDALQKFLAERNARSNHKILPSRSLEQSKELTQDLFERSTTSKKTQFTSVPSKESKKTEAPPSIPEIATETTPATEERDSGVSDAIWNQLQGDKVAQEYARIEMEKAKVSAEAASNQAAAEAARSLAEVEKLALEREKNDQLEELKRRHEEARLKHLVAKRARDEAEERARKIREEAERKQKEEAIVQAKLRDMGVCCAGFRWIKQSDGYRCAGGMHFVSNGHLGL